MLAKQRRDSLDDVESERGRNPLVTLVLLMAGVIGLLLALLLWALFMR